jgi:hypothetical protein
MSYDPAWDMPQVNWQQQGSYEQGEIPLVVNPSDAPLVCIPPINRYWLPYILGCLDQLINPSSWITASDAATAAILDRAVALKQLVAQAGPCPMYQLQLTAGCVLQYSTDGGSTWADVAGWDANFSNCVSSVTIPIIPPNPGGDPILQHACNIAGYIAQEILQASITKAVTDYNASRTQLQFANDVLQDIAFAFPLTALAVDAFVLLYNEYTSLTIADFTSASTDPVLWSDVTCAIFSAIKATGYITAGNVGAVIANVCAITYTATDVITALCAFISNIGLQNLQGMQNIGAVDNVDCTGCSGYYTWCFNFDFTVSQMGWNQFHANPTTWTPGVGWVSGNNTLSCVDIYTNVAIGYCVSVEIFAQTVDVAPNPSNRQVEDTAGGNVHQYTQANGVLDVLVPVGHALGNVLVVLESGLAGVGIDKITAIKIRGTGTCPFGVPNCI